jgi:hypothetical protein
MVEKGSRVNVTDGKDLSSRSREWWRRVFLIQKASC